MKDKSKALMFLLIFVSCGVAVVAMAVPNLMSYQGKLNDRQGNPINGNRSMIFTIYDAASSGNILWTESQDVVVTNGIFNVELGGVNPLLGTEFMSDTLYLGIKIGTDSEMIPRQRITSGGYAFRSASSDALGRSMSDVSRLLVNTVMVKELSGVNVDFYSDDNTLLIDYSNSSQLTGSFNTPTSFLDANLPWYSSGLKTVYNGLVYDDFSDGIVDITKWSGVALSESANSAVMSNVSPCNSCTASIIAKGTTTSLNLKPVNVSSEAILRFYSYANDNSSNSSWTVRSYFGITDGTNEVFLRSSSSTNTLNFSATVRVEIVGTTAYVYSSDFDSPEVKTTVSLSSLTGPEWYFFGRINGYSVARYYFYPIAYSNSSDIPNAEIATTNSPVNLSNNGHIFDSGENVSRYISLNGGANFTPVSMGEMFTTDYPGAQAQLKYVLGGNNLETLPKVSVSVLNTNLL